MKRLSNRERRKQLKVIAAIPDDRIDTTDIPELTDRQLRQAIRGQMYRPIKKPVTMRLDADIIDWLKQDGKGYQTKANALLRNEMLRSYRKKRLRRGAVRSNKTKRSRAG